MSRSLISSCLILLVAFVTNPGTDAACYTNTSTKVNGDIDLTDALHSCVSFPDLEEVTGDLNVEDCERMVSFEAPNLKTVGGGVFFDSNDALVELSLPALTTIAGTLAVRYHGTNLTTISLPKLEIVECLFGDRTADHYWDNVFDISYNKGVSKMDFSQLANISCGTIGFNSQGKLVDMVLPSLKYTGGLTSADGKLLETISLPAFEVTMGTLMFDRAPLLKSISAPNMKQIGRIGSGYDSLWLRYLPNLTSISFPNLVDAGEIEIEYVEALTVANFPKLQNVYGSIYYTNCTSLVTTTMPELGKVGSRIELKKNLALTSFVLPKVSAFQSMTVEGNSDLWDLQLPAVTKIDGDFEFDKNPKMINLNFSSLLAIHGEISVTNDGLGSADFKLPHLYSIGDIVTIEDNKFLASISFPMLISAHNSLNFTNNAKLSWIDMSKLKLVAGTVGLNNNPMLYSVSFCSVLHADELIYTQTPLLFRCAAVGFSSTKPSPCQSACPVPNQQKDENPPAASSNGGLKAALAIFIILLIASWAAFLILKLRGYISVGYSRMPGESKRVNGGSNDCEELGYGGLK